jgi:uncharacterized protein
MDVIQQLAKELNLKISQVESTVKLIDDGNTIPFIARYRKEVTGELSDEVLRDLDDRLAYLRNLEDRKQEVIRLIEEQGKLTDELKDLIESAKVLQRVEDLYKPFKQKKSTRASKAKEKGLEPLALIIFAQELTSGTLEEVAKPFVTHVADGAASDGADSVEASSNDASSNGADSVEEAIQGAMDIIAEMISDDPEIIAMVRSKTQASGLIVTEAVNAEESTVFDMYYEHQEAIGKIPNHRVLAINRGEKEKKLKVKIVPPADQIIEELNKSVIKNEKSIFFELMRAVIEDSNKRLIAPSIEREMRNFLTDKAELEAVKVFGKNTEKLLMVPPVKGARVISIDPGFRTGCKVAVLNETGKLVAYTTIYPTVPKQDIAGTEATLKKLAEKFDINIIVIGNGTGSRETEEVVANFIKKNNFDISYTIVNEAGASIYSASKIATEEYPDLDVTTRGAMSLGRRLQDPLAELVKISPKHIGVGQYQHDINQTLLDGALTNVVEDCVNRVGVDLNTASPSLLSYIAGVNMTIAKNIVNYREENGSFKDRKELKKVGKLGEKTYKQCAGFMRISEAKNPLDGTSVHPESYGAVEAMFKKLGIKKEEIGKGAAETIEMKIGELYPEKSMEKMAEEIGIGPITLKDIIEEIKKPGRDPREDAPPVVFRNDVRSFEDLKVDMELSGTVRNVVDFGAFVDIGVKSDGLVHISQMSDKFIKHPMDLVSVGDTVKVKILSIDYEKHKVSLTMKLS